MDGVCDDTVLWWLMWNDITKTHVFTWKCFCFVFLLLLAVQCSDFNAWKSLCKKKKVMKRVMIYICMLRCATDCFFVFLQNPLWTSNVDFVQGPKMSHILPLVIWTEPERKIALAVSIILHNATTCTQYMFMIHNTLRQSFYYHSFIKKNEWKSFILCLSIFNMIKCIKWEFFKSYWTFRAFRQ